jgi:hypothetical protein
MGAPSPTLGGLSWRRASMTGDVSAPQASYSLLAFFSFLFFSSFSFVCLFVLGFFVLFCFVLFCFCWEVLNNFFYFLV